MMTGIVCLFTGLIIGWVLQGARKNVLDKHMISHMQYLNREVDRYHKENLWMVKRMANMEPTDEKLPS